MVDHWPQALKNFINVKLRTNIKAAELVGGRGRGLTVKAMLIQMLESIPEGVDVRKPRWFAMLEEQEVKDIARSGGMWFLNAELALYPLEVGIDLGVSWMPGSAGWTAEEQVILPHTIEGSVWRPFHDYCVKYGVINESMYTYMALLLENIALEAATEYVIGNEELCDVGDEIPAGAETVDINSEIGVVIVESRKKRYSLSARLWNLV